MAEKAMSFEQLRQTMQESWKRSEKDWENSGEKLAYHAKKTTPVDPNKCTANCIFSSNNAIRSSKTNYCPINKVYYTLHKEQKMAEAAESFEQLRQMFREIADLQRASLEEREKEREQDRKEREKQREEREKEWEKKWAKSDKEWAEIWAQSRELSRKMAETDRQVKQTTLEVEKLTKQMGGLHRSLGELIETLVASRLWEKFSGYPYNFSQGHQRVGVHDEKGVRRTEVDIMLTDGEWAMAVEVKREPDEKDVDYHLKRMELVRKYPPAVAKGKKLLGAMAGGVVSPDVRQYAHQAGLFVLELNGDNVALVPPPDGFSPEVWGLEE
jgi:hypothetical protein